MAIRRNDSEVSCFIKYLVFGFNTFFWFIGCGLMAIGLWAWSDKEAYSRMEDLTSFYLDPAWAMMIVGMIMFWIGFCGCLGALRENTILLLMYCILVGVILAVQLTTGILLFVFKEKVHDELKSHLLKAVVTYRDDADRQNLIDWVQADWLECCGVESPHDWQLNVYFNCSSPSREKCGVPFSCCTKTAKSAMGILNKQCGYDTRTEERRVKGDKIYTRGCFDAFGSWLQKNLVPFAAVVVSIALVQLIGLCLGCKLRGDIRQATSEYRHVLKQARKNGIKI